MKIKSEEEAKFFECHNCLLMNYDPLAKVILDRVLVDPFFIHPGMSCETYLKHFTIDHNLYEYIKQTPAKGIEVRCVIIDGITHE